jgi:type VI secretion system secreted protein VgrG
MARSLDIATPLGPDVFTLIEFSGHEHLSRISEFALRLKSKRPDIIADKMLGQNVTVRIELAKGRQRYFNGYVTRWAGVTEIRDSILGAKETKAYVYEATVHPWLWFLTRQANSRIFQNKTVPQIVEEVFKAHGGLASFKNSTTASYPTWEFCCQYRETDFNFVNRLLEQEGIYYFVEHDNGKHTVTLVDNSSTHKPYPGYDEIRFDEEDRGDVELVRHWHSQHEIQPGRYVVNDYNPLTPRTRLEAFAEKPVSHPYGTFEFYDYPAEYEKPADGQHYARVRIDEFHTQYQSFTGRATYVVFSPAASTNSRAIRWHPSTTSTSSSAPPTRPAATPKPVAAALASSSAVASAPFPTSSNTAHRAQHPSRLPKARRPRWWSAQQAKRSTPMRMAG